MRARTAMRAKNVHTEPRDDDSNHVVATVSPAVPGAPRPKTGRPRKAGLLAPGSSLASAFPRLSPSGTWMVARRLQLRGQPRSSTAFPFTSHTGTLRAAGTGVADSIRLFLR